MSFMYILMFFVVIFTDMQPQIVYKVTELFDVSKLHLLLLTLQAFSFFSTFQNIK